MPIITKEEIRKEIGRLGLEVKSFKSFAELGIAGQGSRALENYFKQNKNDATIFRVRQGEEKQFVDHLRSLGLQGEVLHRSKKYAYTALMPLVAAQNDNNAKFIAGDPTLKAVEEFQGEGARVLTQPNVYYLSMDGAFRSDKLDVGGHGDLILLMVRQKDELAKMLRDEMVWHHNQGDDLGNQFSNQAMSYLVQTGQTPFSALMTAQEIYFEGGAQEARGQLEEAWTKVEEIIAEASSTKLEPLKQRDLMIKAMEQYQATVFKPAQEQDIIIRQKAGGHVADVGGQAKFIEQSHFTKNVQIQDSTGATHTFDQKIFLAIMQRDFNTNNFCLDPLAIAANRDPQIKRAYHDFLKFAQENRADREAVKKTIKKRREVEKFAVERLNEIGVDEWDARCQLLERLMFAVAPLPCEVKGSGAGQYIKLNLMAQDVSTYEAMLSLTDVTALDVDLEKLAEVFKAAKGSAAEKANAKNSGLKAAGIRLARTPGLERVKNLAIIRIGVKDFTQAKDEFGQVNDRLNEVVGNFFVQDITMLKQQARTGQLWATEAQSNGVIKANTARVYRELCEDIEERGEPTLSKQPKDLAEAKAAVLKALAELGGKKNEKQGSGQSLETDNAFYRVKLAFMHLIRLKVFPGEDNVFLYKWSRAFESNGEKLTQPQLMLSAFQVMQSNGEISTKEFSDSVRRLKT
ncbi:MAG: hypothetical protein HGA87_06795, partial [Desulfobulbaceae bacterium]|nr:hypothetical protein [Desulfobulbaceae bacterium]